MSDPRFTVRLGHSPDPDDAFMWFPLANFSVEQSPDGKVHTPQIDTDRFDFVHVLEDIQSLNQRSETGELEITALSMAHYPHVADQYVLTSCGASMGDGYGPMVVTPDNAKVTLGDIHSGSATLAIPGDRTTAWLAFRLLMAQQPGESRVRATVVPFDQIMPSLLQGKFDAGLIIHEGQLTYQDAKMTCLADLGQWWKEKHNLPLQLGGNAIRRDVADLFDGALPRLCRVLYDSICHALAHRSESVAFAMNYGRDLSTDLADRFVGMYVNQWTLDLGQQGRESVRRLLKLGAEQQLVPQVDRLDFVEPRSQ